MRELLEGPRKKMQEPTAIKHPQTGKLIVSGTEIKAVTMEYCIATLQNKKPDKEYEKLINLKILAFTILASKDVRSIYC